MEKGVEVSDVLNLEGSTQMRYLTVTSVLFLHTDV